LKYRLFGCGKYRRLMNEKFDRTLGVGEREFMARHRAVCDDCRREEIQGTCALNMLRLAASEEDDFSNGMVFEERVLRRLRVQTTRESVRYWSPAFVGAVIAGITVLAALQLVSNRPNTPNSTNPPGEARLNRELGRLPVIDLDKIERMR
jgi:hypothetical protein